MAAAQITSQLLTRTHSYCEAVEVLYKANYFSFRGMTGTSSFRTLVTPANWNMLRKLHISTTFLTPKYGLMITQNNGLRLPGENYYEWERGCHILGYLLELRVVRFEITFMHKHQLHDSDPLVIDQEPVIFVLGACKLIRAQEFLVELNLELPHTTIQRLSGIPFTILRHSKQYDWKTFSS